MEDDVWKNSAEAAVFRIAPEPADALSTTGMVVEGEAGGEVATEAIV